MAGLLSWAHSGAPHFHARARSGALHISPCRGAPGLAAGQNTRQTHPTVCSGDPHFHARAPRARSRAQHLYARARSGAPHFSPCRGTYLSKWLPSQVMFLYILAPVKVWIIIIIITGSYYRTKAFNPLKTSPPPPPVMTKFSCLSTYLKPHFDEILFFPWSVTTNPCREDNLPAVRHPWLSVMDRSGVKRERDKVCVSVLKAELFIYTVA